MKKRCLLLLIICFLCIIPNGVRGETKVLHGNMKSGSCYVRYALDYSFADNPTTYVATLRYYFTVTSTTGSSSRCQTTFYEFYPYEESTAKASPNYSASANAIINPTTYVRGNRYTLDRVVKQVNETVEVFTYTLTWNKTRSAQSLPPLWYGLCYREMTCGPRPTDSEYINHSFYQFGVLGRVTVPAIPSYAVTYNANGGTGAPGAQTKWYGENLTLSTAKPTRAGYTFVEWNTKEDGTGDPYSPGLIYASNAALTLYAQWTPNKYTVKYNSNGGTGEAPEEQSFTYDEEKNLSSNTFTKTNNRFISWNTKADGTGTNYANGASVKNLTGDDGGEVTLYANWAPAVVTLDGNEITKDEEGRYIIYNSQKEKYKKQFGIKIYNDNFNTDVVIRDSECEYLWLDEGTYKIKEIFTDEYRLENVTGLSGNNGSLTVEADQEYNIKFHNKYFKNDSYAHSYGRVENKIEAS